MDTQQPSRRSSRDSRPPAYLQQYEVQYPGARRATCETESQTECQHSDKDTHGLQDPVGESERPPETSLVPLPTTQDEVMRELLTTMREIKQFMVQSSPSHSRSSRSSIRTVSSDGIKASVCSLRASPQTHQQHEQLPVIDTVTCQSPFQPPQISRQSGLVTAASPPLPNSTILDAAIPSTGLPRPVLATEDETPFDFLALSRQDPDQISCVQPAVPLAEDPVQPLIRISDHKHCPPLEQQPATSNTSYEQKPLISGTASSGHSSSTRTHVYKLEGPSFPDLSREDEMQYRMLRMALTNLLDPHETEHFKYHVLLDHLKVDQAKRLALAFSYAPDPYTQAIKALDERYGQPRQLALKELKNILELPPIRAGDGQSLDNFALRVQALVGLLSTMGEQGRAELDCGSHVDSLLVKLPAEHFSRFKRHVYREQGEMTYTLPLFSSWLQMECRCQPKKASPVPSFNQTRPARKYASPLTTILHEANTSDDSVHATQPIMTTKATCAYCCSPEHHISKCPGFIQKTKDEKTNWIKVNKRCWRCARNHQAPKCDLKKACATCMGLHLQILCDVNKRSKTDTHPVVRTLYFDRPSDCPSVLLKVVKVLLRNGKRTLETYAVLDDGSQRTILLTSAAQHLNLTGEAERLSLRTVRQEVETIHGSSSFPSAELARTLLDKLRNHLSEGGFDLRQWASNNPVVISHLPSEVRTASNELCLTEDKPSGPHERTLGLLWNCETDLFAYKYRTLASHPTTMRRIYAVLARLYDPLGYLLPFTTRAKTLVQELWRKERDWDDPSLPHDLLEAWKSWEEELCYLPQIAIPRCYTSKEMDVSTTVRDIHIFCDASERAYGAVAYLRSDDLEGHVELSFLLARSCVAPKRHLTIPRLELCAALLGARLSELIQTELTLPVRTTTLWSDSTTVLHWLQSDSCRFKADDDGDMHKYWQITSGDTS
ncbi:uncharacterized protein LOC113027212 [Astatotilapia calliptera]|uniref:uncharacterized protein LOC113027212 n=1 Tax=Astatotilapia calliptera TaxID=8154 RepID=UPI000E4256EE|nr:uncharacterized protein LOC113027212 [Astatotilapia calliptera]